ncbi:unnamed protein product [Schistosoma margrebowiei]|uniref:Uncharacterized protein n=1 Tax=Schistosoma margrebowiei TaxID=48269 RepID=A0A183MZ33_9TREM|nr:unnamed protein product [Schistosoma margrebowiei]
MDSHYESHTTMPKSDGKSGTHPGVTEKKNQITAKTNDCLLDKSLVDSQTNPRKLQSKASSNTVVSHSQDSVTIKANRKIPVVNIQDLTSRSKAVNTISKEAKPLPSLIIWNLEESKDNDPARRHAHDLQLVESVVRNVLPEEVSGVHIAKVIRLVVLIINSHGIQWTSKMQLGDLDFSDDLALLSQTQQQMQEKMNSVAAASAAIGLNIHKGKSKVLR